MKIWLKRTIKIILVVIVLIGSYSTATLVLCNRSHKYDLFYEKEEYDVLFLGSSHMMDSIYPLELWKEYGIKSYNMGNSVETVAQSYWVLKNSLDYHVPKIVVVDIFFAGNFKVMDGKESFMHSYYDSLPYSKNKIEAIKDLLPTEQREEFFWNFSLYHSRWNDLKQSDFEKKDKDIMRGAVPLCGYFNPGEIVYTEDQGDTAGLTVSYLRMMKQLCDDNNISLVICHMPYAANEAEQIQHNSYQDIADELEIDYLNLINNNVVNYEVDLYDRGHLNISGARKITRFFGRYLIEKYDINTTKDDTTWQVDYAKYYENKKNSIINTTNVYSYLVYLYDEDFRCDIHINKNAELYNDGNIEKLIFNICNANIEEKTGGEYGLEIWVYDNMTGEVVDYKNFGSDNV